ncbi:MAG: hypothetical protein QOE11_2550 [Solirubrobacteraceae bacterium]|jgi:hypothetical protein|nr:hypothetical protein [Solirubrobacteraceae bacterium]
MKFGKRRWEAKLEAKEAKESGGSDAAAPSPEPVVESWNVPAEPESTSVAPPSGDEDVADTVVDGEAVELPTTEVAPEDTLPVAEDPADEPVPAEAPEPESIYAAPQMADPEPAAAVAEPEPVVPEPEPEPEPVYVPPPPAPVAAMPPSRPPGVPLPPPGAAWETPVAEEPVLVYTSGSEADGATALSDAGEAYASGHAPGTSPSWPEPVMAIAAERPEFVVGAAFAGGLLLAAILRRLGN